VEGVWQEFGAGEGAVLALRDVSFEVSDGEFVSIVGESGCGKTTLLRMLGGLIRPTRGRVVVDGERVDRPRRDMGFVFQRSVLLDWRTALDNVLLPVEVRGLGRLEHETDARALLKLVGLEGFEAKFPRQLSGGMQQRVALARALILNPSLLLMDEPFGALDAITREQMNTELLTILRQRRATTVFITHDIAEAVFLSDRVVLMGRRPGTVRRVFATPAGWGRTPELRFAEAFTACCREIKSAMLVADEPRGEERREP
jgi:NitT/TauT family transport system ATP-binding protein